MLGKVLRDFGGALVHFCGYFSLFYVMSRYFTIFSARLRYFLLFHAILLGFSFMFDSMISYLSLLEFCLKAFEGLLVGLIRVL